MHRFSILVFLFIFSNSLHAQEKNVDVKYFSTQPNISIRALEVLNDSTVWFAAHKGVWGYTVDAGKTWHIDSIQYDGKAPQFRSIAVLDEITILLLSIESPALLYKTTDKGKNWKLVYTDTNKDIFFDCMKFVDAKHGYAIGDPIDGCMQLIETNDAGNTWNRVACTTLPTIENGEAFFASSNTSIALYGKKMWIATGGLKSRVLHQSQNNKSFQIQNPGILQGEKMGGIFSIDFYNKNIGAVVGGNYDKVDASIESIFYTKDAGKSWKAFKTPVPYFGSCVQFMSKNNFYVTSNSGTTKFDLKSNKSLELLDANQQKLKFNTLRISPSGKTIWLAGSAGRIARLKN